MTSAGEKRLRLPQGDTSRKSPRLSGQAAWDALLAGDLPKVRQYLFGLQDGRITKDIPCPIKINGTNVRDLIGSLKKLPPEEAVWGIALLAFAYHVFVVPNHKLGDILEEGLRKNGEFRKFFLRQNLQSWYSVEAWMGIHGTPEWGSLENLPVLRSIPDILRVHVEKGYPLPDCGKSLRAILGAVKYHPKVGKLVHRFAEKFVNVAETHEELGFLFYAGVITDEDTMLSKMLGMRTKPIIFTSVLALMAIRRVIPMIWERVLVVGLSRLTFDGIALEELRVWHTHVGDFPKDFVMTASPDVFATFAPHLRQFDNLDNIFACLGRFGGFSSVSELQTIAHGFHSRVLEMLRNEDEMNPSPPENEKVISKIIARLERFQSDKDFQKMFLCVLLLVSPEVVERVLRERRPQIKWVFHCITANVLRQILSGNAEIVIPQRQHRILLIFLPSLNYELNGSLVFHKIVSLTGRTSWTISNVGSIETQSFCPSLGALTVLPMDWRARLHWKMHGVLVDSGVWQESMGEIHRLLEDHLANRANILQLLASWLNLLLNKVVVPKEAVKGFIEGLSDAWRAELRSSRVHSVIRQQVRALFEADDNRTSLQRMQQDIERSVPQIGVDYFSRLLRQRLIEAEWLERIAKKEIVKCCKCENVGESALAKETSCCHKIVCGSCSQQVLREKKCSLCSTQTPLLVNVLEVNVDEQLTEVFG